MRYPIAIEVGTETTAYGVVVPDLPGFFSAGDILDEAVTAAEEAAAASIDATLDAGGHVPAPSSLEAVRALPEYAGGGYLASSLWTRHGIVEKGYRCGHTAHYVARTAETRKGVRAGTAAPPVASRHCYDHDSDGRPSTYPLSQGARRDVWEPDRTRGAVRLPRAR